MNRKTILVLLALAVALPTLAMKKPGKTKLTSGTTATVHIDGVGSMTWAATPDTWKLSNGAVLAGWTTCSMGEAGKDWVDSVAKDYDHIIVVTGRSGMSNGSSTPDQGHLAEDVGVFAKSAAKAKIKIVDVHGKDHQATVAEAVKETSGGAKTLVLLNWCWSNKNETHFN